MAFYHFTTRWRIPAPLAAVYVLIADTHAWPDWWRGLETVEDLQPGDATGIGGVQRFVWKSWLQYRIGFNARTVQVNPEVEILATVAGDLEGFGRWLFAHEDGVTIVHYLWQVRTTRRWMNWVAPLARPLFRANHHWLMHQGAKGLARRLHVPLLEVRHLDAVAPANSTLGTPV